MIVVDANVIACLYLEGEHTRRAEALLARDPDWAAPVRSILAGCLGRGTLGFDAAHALQREAEDLRVGAEHEVSSPRVMALVRDTDCSAYDCEFAALALSLGVKLVTPDVELPKAFPRLAPPFRPPERRATHPAPTRSGKRP